MPLELRPLPIIVGVGAIAHFSAIAMTFRSDRLSVHVRVIILMLTSQLSSILSKLICASMPLIIEDRGRAGFVNMGSILISSIFGSSGRSYLSSPWASRLAKFALISAPNEILVTLELDRVKLNGLRNFLFFTVCLIRCASIGCMHLLIGGRKIMWIDENPDVKPQQKSDDTYRISYYIRYVAEVLVIPPIRIDKNEKSTVFVMGICALMQLTTQLDFVAFLLLFRGLAFLFVEFNCSAANSIDIYARDHADIKKAKAEEEKKRKAEKEKPKKEKVNKENADDNDDEGKAITSSELDRSSEVAADWEVQKEIRPDAMAEIEKWCDDTIVTKKDFSNAKADSCAIRTVRGQAACFHASQDVVFTVLHAFWDSVSNLPSDISSYKIHIDGQDLVPLRVEITNCDQAIDDAIVRLTFATGTIKRQINGIIPIVDINKDKAICVFMAGQEGLRFSTPNIRPLECDPWYYLTYDFFTQQSDSGKPIYAIMRGGGIGVAALHIGKNSGRKFNMALEAHARSPWIHVAGSKEPIRPLEVVTKELASFRTNLINVWDKFAKEFRVQDEAERERERQLVAQMEKSAEELEKHIQKLRSEGGQPRNGRQKNKKNKNRPPEVSLAGEPAASLNLESDVKHADG